MFWLMSYNSLELFRWNAKKMLLITLKVHQSLKNIKLNYDSGVFITRQLN